MTGAVFSANDRRFLARPRIGILSVGRPRHRSMPMPVWFEATSAGVQLVTDPASAKVRRVEEAGSAALLVANEVGEPDHWLSISGTATVHSDDANDLAARLAERYWDLDDPALSTIYESWRTADLRRIEIRADQVRRYR